MRQIIGNGFKLLLTGIITFNLSSCRHQEPGPCDLNPGPKNYNISGQLVESFTHKPVKDQVIKLYGFGLYVFDTEMANVITDDSGYFAFSGQVFCPNPLPAYLQVDGNAWRCTVQLHSFDDSLFEIPPMAHIMMNLHRIDPYADFDSIVVSYGCCCALPKVQLLSSATFVNDTSVLSPIGGNQTQTVFWSKYKNNQITGRDSFEVIIPGIDTVGITVNF